MHIKLYFILTPLAAICLCLLLGASSLALAQESIPLESLASQPSETGESADSDQSLLLDRQPIPIIPPKLSALPPPVKPMVVLEERITDRKCRLNAKSDGSWRMVTFLEEPNKPPLPPHRLLPCPWLETMEKAAASSGEVVFRVTGDVAGYYGKLYFLPVQASIDTLEKTVATKKPAVVATTNVLPVSPKSQPFIAAVPLRTSRPATVPAGGEELNAEPILSQMLENRPGKPIIMPSPPYRYNEPDTQAVAPLPRHIDPPVDSGNMIVDRTIRIVRSADGQWLEARFISDNTLQEGPIRLLPNSLLQRAEKIDGKVRISGVIETYKGQNFLLLRKAFRERDMGQF